ncbi:Endonuclease 4 [Planctomycetes bacterium Pan216]|uniref:Probable endonuclease 4 n=1 Tax=Kolteria novifilia TaxID=2527975 RepID=A0A518B514_9BACT|nr:Endonuclease 4 [Planctomycetes bacterium Pan216]
MPIFGSHLSIAGGYYKAAQEAGRLGLQAVQIFTKNNNQWRAKPLVEQDVELFQNAFAEAGLLHAISHDSYLINLASPDDELWNKSIDALVVELERAKALGIPHVVAHPGSHPGEESVGLARIAAGLDQVFCRTAELAATVALETTAGQGNNLGHRFEHLGAIIEQCAYPERLTLCVDTCHIFAAGYPLAPKRRYNQTMRELEEAVGFDRLVAVHANDSKKAFGSRVDRHEHIGRGFLGLEPFEHLVNDRRFRDVPLYLETPKGEDPETKRPWDTINVETLQGLVKKRPTTKRSQSQA